MGLLLAYMITVRNTVNLISTTWGYWFQLIGQLFVMCELPPTRISRRAHCATGFCFRCEIFVYRELTVNAITNTI